MSNYRITYSNSLSHHGIKGQHWGQRRYQNEDGSLTDAGRARYNVGDARRAALTGGLIGYAHYRRTHSGRNEAIAEYKREKSKKATERDFEASKRMGLVKNRKEYDSAMKAATDGARKGMERKRDKKLAKSEKYRNRINKERELARSAKESYYDRKIEKATKKGNDAKAKELTSKKKASLKDHDAGTRYVNKALKYRDSTIKNYYNMKVSSLNDAGAKYTDKYKNAGKEYHKMLASDVLWGKDYTTLMKASDYAVDDVTKKKNK